MSSRKGRMVRVVDTAVEVDEVTRTERARSRWWTCERCGQSVRDEPRFRAAVHNRSGPACEREVDICATCAEDWSEAVTS